MANARFSSVKGNQRNSDQAYEGEQSNAGAGEKQSTAGVQRDHVAKFGKREDVNNMTGSGGTVPMGGEYKLKKNG